MLVQHAVHLSRSGVYLFQTYTKSGFIKQQTFKEPSLFFSTFYKFECGWGAWLDRLLRPEGNSAGHQPAQHSGIAARGSRMTSRVKSKQRERQTKAWKKHGNRQRHRKGDGGVLKKEAVPAPVDEGQDKEKFVC